MSPHGGIPTSSGQAGLVDGRGLGQHQDQKLSWPDLKLAPGGADFGWALAGWMEPCGRPLFPLQECQWPRGSCQGVSLEHSLLLKSSLPGRLSCLLSGVKNLKIHFCQLPHEGWEPSSGFFKFFLISGDD